MEVEQIFFLVVVDARQKPAGVTLQTARKIQFSDGRCGMGGGVYTTGQAGHDDQSRFCKTGRPTMGYPRSQGGDIACAHDRNAGARELFLMT